MNEIELAGTRESALTHFLGVGVASILEEAGTAPVRFRWTDDLEPRLVLAVNADVLDIAKWVQMHAQRHTTPASWVSQRSTVGARAGTGMFTVRARQPAEPDWSLFVAERDRVWRALDLSILDERLLAALGEPAWWLLETKGRSPDDGASRWEMKTRNKGQEFIVDRFSPLAEAVAAREIGEVAEGLLGDSVRDETGKDAANSRTSTGLTTPMPVDSAVAWCALWGLNVMSTVHRRNAISQSAGVWPRRGVHPRVAVLPLFTQPVSVRRYADFVTSSHLERAGSVLALGEAEAEEYLAANESRTWLRSQGVRALVRFEILRTGSSSAPERQLLAGETHVL